MGLTLALDEVAQLLVLNDGNHSLELRMSDDILVGLKLSRLNMRMNGTLTGRTAPRAIHLDRYIFIAVTPVITAFGGSVAWIPETRTVRVEPPNVDPFD